MELHLMLFLCVAVCSFTGKEVAGNAPLVYFKASLPKSLNAGYYYFGVGSIIPFSSVEANIGHGYNPTSGVFHAPVSGYYQFQTLLQTERGPRQGTSDFGLFSQGYAKAWLTIPMPYASTSMSVIIHVNKADHVFVKKTLDNGKSPLRQGA
ncbi:complement C1q-like protein 4 [Haliotis rufescens]|uniref:complement C1q-like protein 4 n=1 Tax=Haliotis rufescens TaxID=6454 RepID=UPI00201ED3F7|nr:complement C1q-like protein 4 [Haliotis rufescens]